MLRWYTWRKGLYPSTSPPGNAIKLSVITTPASREAYGDKPHDRDGSAYRGPLLGNVIEVRRPSTRWGGKFLVVHPV